MYTIFALKRKPKKASKYIKMAPKALHLVKKKTVSKPKFLIVEKSLISISIMHINTTLEKYLFYMIYGLSFYIGRNINLGNFFPLYARM